MRKAIDTSFRVIVGMSTALATGLDRVGHTLLVVLLYMQACT